MMQCAMAPGRRARRSRRVHYWLRICRGGLYGSFCGAMLCGIGWLTHWLCDAHRWPLSRIIITGQRQLTSDNEVEQAITALKPLDSCLTQKINLMRAQIEALPWVAQASVRKQWPDRLRVHLVEYQPLARWNDQQLIDTQGRLFSAPDNTLARYKLPHWYGPEGSEQQLLTAWQVIAPWAAQNAFEVNVLAINQRQAWRLVVNHQIQLLLGSDSQIERLHRFLKFYQKCTQQQKKSVISIDLRYKKGVAVHWLPVSTGHSRNSSRLIDG